MVFSAAAKNNGVEALEYLNRLWKNVDMDDYYITIRGTTFTEFLDDEWDMVSIIGVIVDNTDTSGSSGILYIKVTDGGYVYTNARFIAVAWQNKANDNIEFATGNYEKATLAEIKTTYGEIADFNEDSFYPYKKR